MVPETPPVKIMFGRGLAVLIHRTRVLLWAGLEVYSTDLYPGRPATPELR